MGIDLRVLHLHNISYAYFVAIAVKVQYPGVEESIESDINNLLSLLTYTGMMPRGLYVENVLKVRTQWLLLPTFSNAPIPVSKGGTEAGDQLRIRSRLSDSLQATSV